MNVPVRVLDSRADLKVRERRMSIFPSRQRGFELVGKSDLLRIPADKRDQISYKPPMLGKTITSYLARRSPSRSFWSAK